MNLASISRRGPLFEPVSILIGKRPYGPVLLKSSYREIHPGSNGKLDRSDRFCVRPSLPSVWSRIPGLSGDRGAYFRRHTRLSAEEGSRGAYLRPKRHSCKRTTRARALLNGHNGTWRVVHRHQAQLEAWCLLPTRIPTGALSFEGNRSHVTMPELDRWLMKILHHRLDFP